MEIIKVIIALIIYDAIKKIIPLFHKNKVMNNRADVTQEQIAKFADPLKGYAQYKDTKTKLYDTIKPPKTNRRET